MAFHDMETFNPNFFLLVTQHDATCFCLPCRNRQVQAIGDKREASLRNALLQVIPNERRNRADMLFQETMKQIVYGKLYKDVCMATTTYKLFKCWAKKQPIYIPYAEGNATRRREFNLHCKLVNDAAFVFQHWETIVDNLTDWRMDSIDARTFSVGYFAKAYSINWCVEYNQKVKNRCSKKSDEKHYSKDDINGIFQHILSTGILDNADMGIASAIGQNIERLCVDYARRNNRV